MVIVDPVNDRGFLYRCIIFTDSILEGGLIGSDPGSGSVPPPTSIVFGFGKPLGSQALRGGPGNRGDSYPVLKIFSQKKEKQSIGTAWRKKFRAGFTGVPRTAILIWRIVRGS